jgi:hypothetical protein
VQFLKITFGFTKYKKEAESLEKFEHPVCRSVLEDNQQQVRFRNIEDNNINLL